MDDPSQVERPATLIVRVCTWLRDEEASVLKAMTNAAELADALAAGEPVDQALSGWSASQQQLAGPVWHAAERVERHRYRRGSAAVPLGQDLGLLALELISGDDPAVAQVGQLGQLVGRVPRARGILDIGAERLVLLLRLLPGPLLHRAAAGDQVDQHADQRDEQHEQ